MFSETNDHFDILNGNLRGAREVDERTHASLAALGERLDSLKKMSGLFAGISFSDDVKKLASQRVAVA
jgi:hypothetical protein